METRGRSAGSMSTTVWKRNEEIDASSLAGPRMQRRNGPRDDLCSSAQP